MDREALDKLIGQMIHDLGGAFSIPLVQIGESLGLYKTLRKEGPMTSVELGHATGLAERYLREWLAAQAASNYISYDAETNKFFMTPEQIAVLADERSPVYLTAAFEVAAAYLDNRPVIEGAFKTGEGIRWSDQPGCLACAVAKFFRPGYENHLVESWLPALEGVVAKLEKGIRVADIGCGHGLSTMIMAKAFPNSEFFGFDFHEGSIVAANKHLKLHNLSNVQFRAGLAKEFPGKYGFITIFDCLHDMGDPSGAMAHVREALEDDGTCMIVEPAAGDDLQSNLNPISRLYYSASTMVCVPTSLAQEVGAALGAQAGEQRLREVIVNGGGFSSFRRAAETPFNLILEARP